MKSATAVQLLQQIDSLAVWSRKGERAPHKPLLILLALGRLLRSETTLPFNECEQDLSALLRDFGPNRLSVHPEYPFWRLQSDNIWEVSADGPLTSRKSNTDPTKTALRAGHAVGRFRDEVQLALQADSDLVAEVVRRLLYGHFPDTLHQDILAAVGLRFNQVNCVSRLRDRGFRSRILTAYEHRCAVCGLDLRIANVTAGIEAAHIMWHQAGGPDIESNGIALCSLHHKLFDIGAFTVHPSMYVLVSELAHGTCFFDVVLLQHHGRLLRRPLRPVFEPDRQFLVWHRRQVFKGNARHVSWDAQPPPASVIDPNGFPQP